MSTEKNKAALTSVIAAVFLTSMKLIVGFATGSLGILSEAAHSGLDLMAAVITAVAVRVSGKPADTSHNYGHGKVENFSALFETLLLLGTCVWIVIEAVHRIKAQDYAVEATVWSFTVIITSIIIDINRSAMLYRAAKKHNSQALEADALHFSSDVLSSSVVLLGLILVKVGIPIGDPIAALGVAVLVIIASIRLGKRTVDALLDTAPRGLQERIREAVVSVDGVISCPTVRVRQSGADSFVDIRVELDKECHLHDVDDIIRSIENAVQSLVPTADVMVRPIPVYDAALQPLDQAN